VAWGAVWGLHAWLLRRSTLAPVGPLSDLAVLAGSAVGVVALAIGAGVVSDGLEQVYHAIAGPALVEAAATAALRRSLVVTALAAVVWWWHWLRRAVNAARTTPWHRYVLLVGVLGGLLTAVGAAAVALHTVAQWFTGEPEAGRAAVHFVGRPTSLAAGAVGQDVLRSRWPTPNLLPTGPARRPRGARRPRSRRPGPPAPAPRGRGRPPRPPSR
jgi:hypothetical protein